jgi:murein DD-endopeptidase MepM/ murein hydrolase activator NlpD
MKPTENNLKPVMLLEQLLIQHQHDFFPVMQWPSLPSQIKLLDFTIKNEALQGVALEDTNLFNAFVEALLEQDQALMGVGGYFENRTIYRRSTHFTGSESRCIHLGVDIWAPAFTPIFTPLDSVVHSFKDNKGFGDYGPTIILEHQLGENHFYSLYGHLSKRSLEDLSIGQVIKKGTAFSALGPAPENGDWPPHLHFQLIADMQGMAGDFPGVAAPSEIEKYKMLCPDPNLILNLPQLKK